MRRKSGWTEGGRQFAVLSVSYRSVIMFIPPLFIQMQGLKSDDFCLSPEVADQSWAYPPYITDSAAGCMEVYECQDFSLGIFLLKPNSCMPLHDHPGMHGIM